MKKYEVLYYKSILFLLLFMSTAFSQFITLSTEKEGYLIYEPIFLEIEYQGDLVPDGFYVSSLKSAYSQIGLVMSTPAQEEPIRYRPFGRLLDMGSGEKDFICFETVIIHNSTVITAQAGVYELFIIDKKTDQIISNRIVLSFSNPGNTEEVKAIEIIKESPGAYGLFTYLGGGDHIPKGKEIIEKLSVEKTALKGMAGALAALNYSLTFYDWKNNKLKRGADAKKVDQFFPDITECAVPKYLCLKSASIIAKRIKKDKLKDKTKVRIGKVKARYKKYIDNKQEFSVLKEM